MIQLTGSFRLNNGIKDIFGFKEDSYHAQVYPLKGELAPSVRASIYSIFVYCNIIKDQHVGHQNVPLLRVVPLSAMPGKVVNVNFENLHYCPLNTSHIPKIKIFLHDDAGAPIRFDEGKVIMVVNLRPRQ